MKITEIKTQILRLPSIDNVADGTQDTFIVRIKTDDGFEGVGECDGSPEVCQAIVDAPYSNLVVSGLRALLIGENPLETDRLWEKMYQQTFYVGRRGAFIVAMAGVDMALWDLKGRILNQPIHRLLGGKRHDRLPAYASILFGRDRHETAEIGARWIEEGYNAVKFGWEPMGKVSEKLDVDLVRGGREGIGDEATLLIDCGCVWDARTALQRANSFSEYKIGWLEEPLRQDDLEGYRWLRDRSPIPIAAGEGECGRQAFNPWLDSRALDIYQVDLCRNGLTDSLHIGKRIQDIGARMVNHCYKSPISVAACLHWISVFTEAFIFEDCVEDSALRNDLCIEKIQATDGYIAIPDGPGLGVTLNEDVVQQYLVGETN